MGRVEGRLVAQARGDGEGGGETPKHGAEQHQLRMGGWERGLSWLPRFDCLFTFRYLLFGFWVLGFIHLIWGVLVHS